MPEMSAARRGEAAGRGPQLCVAGHEYGPHRDDESPEMVTIWRTKRASDGTKDVPVPKGILDQRRRINTLAYEQARAARARGEVE